MRREYNEHGYLKHYIFRWHGDVIPQEEKYPTADYFRRTVPAASEEDIAAILSDDDAEISDASIAKALLAAWDEFNAELCRRVIEQQRLAIHRCPNCNKILESPKARICLWCNYNEYKSVSLQAMP